MMNPEALGLGMTATPVRAEGAGLGSAADGFFDALVEGPQLGEGIDQGFLTPYKIGISEEYVEVDEVPISEDTGDYNKFKLRDTIHKHPTLVGHVVDTYLKLCPGKRAICYVVDIEEAGKTAAAFRDAGVRAQAVSSKTEEGLRDRIMRDFRDGRVDVLVNVDLFGEGVDIPAVEVVIMARPTASLGLYMQMVGRCMRLAVSKILRAAWHTYTVAQRRQFIAESVKPFALVIDHVGNINRHGLPCEPRVWSLNRREKRSRGGAGDAEQLKHCTVPPCFKPYPRVLPVCPHCGKSPEPSPEQRRSLKALDGDFILLDPATMRQMEAEVRDVDGPVRIPGNVTPKTAGAIQKRHLERQRAQRDLRQTIALWAGRWHAIGEDDRTIHKRFYLTFSVDILTAMALGSTDAVALKAKIEAAP